VVDLALAGATVISTTPRAVFGKVSSQQPKTTTSQVQASRRFRGNPILFIFAFAPPRTNNYSTQLRHLTRWASAVTRDRLHGQANNPERNSRLAASGNNPGIIIVSYVPENRSTARRLPKTAEKIFALVYHYLTSL
jgi:hypothetical protein